MKKTVISIIAAFLAVNAFGQSVTDVAPDARSAGMADAYTAMYGKGFSLYTNSAAAALSDDDFAISANYSMLQPKVAGMNSFAVGAFYKFNDRYTVGLGARARMQSVSTVFTDDNGIASGSFDGSVAQFSVDASFGMHIIEGFAAAVNLHFYYDQSPQPIGKVNGIGFGLDVDLMYSHKYFNVALAAKNLGPAMTYEPGISYALPMDIRAGYSGNYEIVDDVFDINPAVDVDYILNNSTLTAGVGAEFEFIDMVAVRGGYRYSANEAFMPSYATVGLGVEFFGIGIDAAYYIGMGKAADVLSNTLKIGISYKF